MEQTDIRNIYEMAFHNMTLSLDDDDIQLQYIVRYLDADKNISILDAGCGNGNYALKLISQGYSHVKAVDLFDTLECAKIDYVRASIDDLPFENNQFDFIYSNSVLYYLEQPQRGINEMYRCLNVGGIFIFTAHTKFSLFTLWRKVKLFMGRSSVEHLQGVKFYSVFEYEEMLRQAGFKVILRDGYRLSFLLYPIWKKYSAFIGNLLGRNIKRRKNRSSITKNKYLALFKAIFAYHSIIVAYKPMHLK